MATLEVSAIWVIVSGSAIVLAIGMAFLKARKYIEDRIKESLSSEEIIGKISLLVKPDMIFDEKGSIVADRGATSFIQDRGIHFTMEDDTFGPIPSEIRISFSRHLKLPPLLTPLNPDSTFVWPERGESHDWIYKLSYSATSHSEKEFVRRYRLEIL
jgi:hypothetical protein